MSDLVPQDVLKESRSGSYDVSEKVMREITTEAQARIQVVFDQFCKDNPEMTFGMVWKPESSSYTIYWYPTDET